LNGGADRDIFTGIKRAPRGIMPVSPIHTDADHDVALARIDALWGAEPGTPEHDELEVLSVLVAAYEDRRWPISPPDPIEALRFHREQNDPS
jgi:HTH-type transcriptional regulator/antitoxin HigA